MTRAPKAGMRRRFSGSSGPGLTGHFPVSVAPSPFHLATPAHSAQELPSDDQPSVTVIVPIWPSATWNEHSYW